MKRIDIFLIFAAISYKLIDMRRFFLILLIALVPAMSFGQEYEPLLKEGKTWKYTHSQPFSEDYYNFSLVVRGDTTINDLTYKKIYDVSTDAYQYALREEGKKVYYIFWTKDTPQLIYDFGKEAGEIVSEVEDKDGKTVLRVLAVDAIKYGDRLLHRMEVVEEYLENDQVIGSGNGIWIEGLGSSCGLVSPVQLPGNNDTFYSCQIGDDMLGENELFFGAKSLDGKKVACDGLRYYLFQDTDKAAIDEGNTWSGELELPSEISYTSVFNFKGEEVYHVNGISHKAFQDCKELTKVRIPKEIENIITYVLSVDEMVGSVPDDMNPFKGCTALESIEVDEDNPALKSVDGILFNKDGSKLYAYPAGKKADSYVVPEDVTWVGMNAFNGCTLGALVIRGILDSSCMSQSLFRGLNESAKLYVQSSEMDRYKDIFPGTILPLEDYQSGIQAPTSLKDQSHPIYNLNGQRIDQPKMGIYIQNSKKVVVR